MVQIGFRSQSDNDMKYSQQKKGGRDKKQSCSFLSNLNDRTGQKQPSMIHFPWFYPQICNLQRCGWFFLAMRDVETISFCLRPNCYPDRPSNFQQIKNMRVHWWMTLTVWIVFSHGIAQISGGHRTEDSIPTVFFDLSDYVRQPSEWQHACFGSLERFFQQFLDASNVGHHTLNLSTQHG